MKQSKFKRFSVIADTHGDHICRATEKAFLGHLDDYKPHAIVHLGDAFDFRALRSGMSNEDGDAYEDLQADLNAGFAHLERVFGRKAKRKIYLLGNHEFRLWRVAHSHPRGIMRHAARQEIERVETFCERHGVELFPYHYKKGVARLGAATFVHGYSANLRSPEQHATVYGTPNGVVAMGHLHRYELARSTRFDNVYGYSIPCCGDFENEFGYAHQRLNTLKWENGYAFGEASKHAANLNVVRRVGEFWSSGAPIADPDTFSND